MFFLSYSSFKPTSVPQSKLGRKKNSTKMASQKMSGEKKTLFKLSNIVQINMQLYKADLNYPDKTTFAIAQIAQIKLQFNFANKIGKKNIANFPNQIAQK